MDSERRTEKLKFVVSCCSDHPLSLLVWGSCGTFGRKFHCGGWQKVKIFQLLMLEGKICRYLPASPNFAVLLLSTKTISGLPSTVCVNTCECSTRIINSDVCNLFPWICHYFITKPYTSDSKIKWFVILRWGHKLWLWPAGLCSYQINMYTKNDFSTHLKWNKLNAFFPPVERFIYSSNEKRMNHFCSPLFSHQQTS